MLGGYKLIPGKIYILSNEIIGLLLFLIEIFDAAYLSSTESSDYEIFKMCSELHRGGQEHKDCQ